MKWSSFFPLALSSGWLKGSKDGMERGGLEEGKSQACTLVGKIRRTLVGRLAVMWPPADTHGHHPPSLGGYGLAPLLSGKPRPSAAWHRKHFKRPRWKCLLSTSEAALPLQGPDWSTLGRDSKQPVVRQRSLSVLGGAGGGLSSEETVQCALIGQKPGQS